MEFGKGCRQLPGLARRPSEHVHGQSAGGLFADAGKGGEAFD